MYPSIWTPPLFLLIAKQIRRKQEEPLIIIYEKMQPFPTVSTKRDAKSNKEEARR